MALIIPSIFSAVDKFSAPVRAMTNSVVSFASKSEAAIQRADRAVNKYFSVFSHAQTELLHTIGAAAIAYKAIGAIEYGFDAVKDYDESITKLQSNFRLSDAAMAPFRKQIMQVADESFIAADKISEVFNVIGSKNRELLKNPAALGIYAKSAVTLSEALKTELIPTSKDLVDIMAGFNLKDPAKAIDIIAASSSSGALKGQELTAALSSIGVAATKAHVGLADASSLLQLLASKTSLGTEAAPALSKAFLKMEKLGLGYDRAGNFSAELFIDNFQKRIASMKTDFAKNNFAESIFGAKTVDKILPLLAPGALAELEKYRKQTQLKGIAEKMAAENTGTLAVAMERVKAAFGNAFIESDKVGTSMNFLKNVLSFVYHHMQGILTTVGLLIGAFIAWKLIVFATRTAMFAYNIVLGITSFLQGESAFVTWGNVVAYNAYRASVIAATAAQWLFDAALTANPVGIVIVAIAALIALTYESIKHWDEWGAAVTLAMGPLGTFISVLKTLYEHWNLIKEAFSGQGIMSGLIQIGRTIQDAILYPIGQLVTIFANLTGAKWATALVPAFAAIHKNLSEGRAGEDYGMSDKKPAINSEKSRQDAMVARTESTQKQNVKIEVNDNTGRANVTSDNDFVPIKTTSTMANGFGGSYAGSW